MSSVILLLRYEFLRLFGAIWRRRRAEGRLNRVLQNYVKVRA
jgi:hypothetical protein